MPDQATFTSCKTFTCSAQYCLSSWHDPASCSRFIQSGVSSGPSTLEYTHASLKIPVQFELPHGHPHFCEDCNAAYPDFSGVDIATAGFPACPAHEAYFVICYTMYSKWSTLPDTHCCRSETSIPSGSVASRRLPAYSRI